LNIHSIAIVDDDSDTRNSMRLILEPLGYAVSVACGGRDAIRLLNSEAVDLVITDIMMPDMDGFELIVALRQRFPKIRSIAISGGGGILKSDTWLQIARGFGADVILQKPITRDHLMTAIKEAETHSWTSA
jgi:CheY-like chemotaxis protein